MTKYISCTETAKLIRQALKENFKGIKFSVRSSNYAGGASINVSWVDGPCDPDVSRVVKQFQGATFDSSIDLQSYVTSQWNGEEVHFGADYVMTNRRFSYVFVEAIAKQFCKYHGVAMLTIRGKEKEAWADTRHLDHSMEHWFNDLLCSTDARDMHRAYAAEDERETRQRAEWEAQAKAEAERKARERTEAKVKAEQEAKAKEQAEFAQWQQEQLHNEAWQREQFKKWQEEQARLVQEEAKRQEEKRQAEAKAKRERQQREQEEQARRQKEQQQRERIASQKHTILSTKTNALAYLGLTLTANRQDVLKAFRDKVKASSDGNGGYTGDMDLLVKAKERALA